jgi:ribosome maturation factor RimP
MAQTPVELQLVEALEAVAAHHGIDIVDVEVTNVVDGELIGEVC